MERLIRIPLGPNEPTLASSGRRCDTCRLDDVPLFRYDVVDREADEQISEGAFAFCSDNCFSSFLPLNREFLALYSQYRREQAFSPEDQLT